MADISILTEDLIKNPGFGRCICVFEAGKITIDTKWKWPEPSNEPTPEWPDADEEFDHDYENMRAVSAFARRARLSGYKIFHFAFPERPST
jgi:hypothetical protein